MVEEIFDRKETCPTCGSVIKKAWLDDYFWGCVFFIFTCGSKWHEVYDEDWVNDVMVLEGCYEDVECPTKRLEVPMT